MKFFFKFGFITWIVLQSLTAFCQNNVGFDWVKTVSSSNAEECFSMTLDISGNLIMTGFFASTVDFNPDPTFTDPLTAVGGRDIYVQKISSSGELRWAKSMGGTSTPDQGMSVTTDPFKNVITVGSFVGTADFNPGAGNSPLTSSGYSDAFVQKMDSSGNFIWAFKIGGATYYDEARSVCTDASSNIYVSGIFRGTVDFDPGTESHPLTSSGNDDIFLAKYNAMGEFQWAVSFGAASSDKPFGVAVDNLYNVYLSGNFWGTVDFDPGSGNSSITSGSGGNIFILKLNASLGLQWVRNIGATSSISNTALTLDYSNNIILAGDFYTKLVFNPGGDSTVLNSTASGSNNAYFCKYDNAGNLLYAKNFGGNSTSGAQAKSIYCDEADNLLLSGSLSGVVDFDPGIETTQITSAGSGDAFVALYDMDGNFQWVKVFQGTISEYCNGAQKDSYGNVFCIGKFAGTTDFNPGTGINNITGAGNSDVFFLKLEPCSCVMNFDTVSPCKGTSYNFPDGTPISNITDTTHHISSFNSFYGCDSLIHTFVKPLEIDTNVNIAGNSLIAVQSGAIYQWLDCNNNFATIPGASAQTYIPPTSGSYAVEITKNFCSDTSACIPLTIVSINDITASQISLNPNPANEFCRIDFYSTEKHAEIEIVDVWGKLIFKNIFYNTDFAIINLLDLKKGIYLIRIQSNNFIGTAKLIKL